MFEKSAAWSLPVIYGVILLTGVMLDQRLGLVWQRDAVRDLHLWSSELALPVTVWHLIRFLPPPGGSHATTPGATGDVGQDERDCWDGISISSILFILSRSFRLLAGSGRP